MEYIQLFLSFRCNQACDFCFNRGIVENTAMSLLDFKILTSKLRAAGIKEIDILGGEPLLHEEIIPILETALDNFDSVFISTNGTNIDLMLKLKKFLLQTKIGISLNSEPEKDLREFIISNRPLLKSIASRKALIPFWAWDFIKRGFPYYIIFRDILHPAELKDSMPFYKFLDGIDKWSKIYPELRPVYCSGFISGEAQWRCPAGSTKLSIMPDGSVFPCYLFFKFSEFRLGNIFDSELEEILRNPILDFFKRQTTNKCDIKSCHVKALCNGGCPAVSYSIYRELTRPDPRCEDVRDN
ncbi:MAG: SPASM domain-containing protein [Thermodesulfovibrionales bacterium]